MLALILMYLRLLLANQVHGISDHALNHISALKFPPSKDASPLDLVSRASYLLP
jgi:hypothetical protein